MRLARSRTLRRDAERFFPLRLMKYWSIRMPEPIPLGLTLRLAMMRAIAAASFVKVPGGGKVDAVLTRLTHRLRTRAIGALADYRRRRRARVRAAFPDAAERWDRVLRRALERA